MSQSKLQLPPLIVVEQGDPVSPPLLRLLSAAGVNNPVVLARDGEELLTVLSSTAHRRGGGRSGRPGLLLLDLDISKTTGFEVLTWIRTHPVLKDLPVVLLASAVEAADVRRAARLGIARFVTKYPTPAALLEIVAEHCPTG